MSHTPTTEQQHICDVFATRADLVIEAGAGTGKTSTLKMLSAATNRKGQYLAFNRAIVLDASKTMPGNVSAKTAHSLAITNVDPQLRRRLENSSRMKSAQVARLLGIDGLAIADTPAGRKYLAAGFLAGHTMQALKNFCSSADEEPTVRHFSRIDPIDMPGAYANNNAVAQHLIIPLRRAWNDWQSPDGRLRWDHAAYLKIWQLTNPQLPVDFVLFDEAQDASPVMRAIVSGQRSAQRVWVGDSQQQIYGFTGAINALAQVDGERTFLTRSFRFGPEIAAVANSVLDRLDADLRIVGAGAPGRVGEVIRPNVVLTRTNAKTLEVAMNELATGSVSNRGSHGRPYIEGGAAHLLSFVRGAAQLDEKGWTSHPELSCFKSWREVQEYADIDPEGVELRMWVNLIDEWGCDQLETALMRCGDPRDSTVTISTAHKSKGCEWGAVIVADDFVTGVSKANGLPVDVSAEELRLLYVAATRARGELDTNLNPLLKV